MPEPEKEQIDYHLSEQVGFLMRRANQRHLGLFGALIPDLTPTQFAAMAKLKEMGKVSQNALGRATAMDAATIKGVVDRLRKRGFVGSVPDPNDQRRFHLHLTPSGEKLIDTQLPAAREASDQTLAPLSPAEQKEFVRLLRKLL